MTNNRSHETATRRQARAGRAADQGLPASEAIIDLQQVVKTYQSASQPFTALRGVSLRVQLGEFVAVVGKSGSGKTTLLNLLAGIDRPSSGAVSIAGTDLHSLSESQLAEWRGRTIGLVFQFFQLLPTLTVAENIMLPMDFAKIVAASERRQGARAALSRRYPGSGRQAPGHPVGRAATARSDCPRAGQRSTHPARRRADWQSRRGY
jgi:predicted ABC-type transport system involved in lysophospholipase L1 biosynthesis ATPase subunit